MRYLDVYQIMISAGWPSPFVDAWRAVAAYQSGPDGRTYSGRVARAA
jgi:hypothetical protein